MSIESIQIRLQAAKDALQIAPHNLKESLQAAYCKKVTEEIEALLAQETAPQGFINYFQENAKLVRGSLLDYTAMPNHPTTKLLCTLAEWVSHNAPDCASLSAMEVLYPDLSLASYANDFPHLNVMPDESETFSKEETLELARLSRLCRVATNTEDPVHEQLANLKEKESRVKAVEAFNAAHYKRKNNQLIPQQPLGQVLSTHILADDLKSLIPVSEILSETPRRIYDADLSPLTENERLRMEKHSFSTECYIRTKATYERLKTDDSNLLGHLTQLCTKLKFNDAHGGIGKAEAAGSGAYGAIAAFNDYYQLLGEEEKQKIPEPIQHEINTLLRLASDKDANLTEQTCIGLRREALERALKSQESTLSRIACSDTQKASLLMEAKQHFEHTMQAVIDEYIKTKDVKDELYADRLPLNASLLQELKIDLQIKSLSDFRQFMDLDPDDIRMLGQLPTIQNAVATIHNTPAEFADFIRNTPEIKLKAYFEITQKLRNRFLANEEALQEVLFELSAERCQQLISALLTNKTFYRLISDNYSLDRMLKPLTSEQQAVILTAIMHDARHIFQSAKQYSEIMPILKILPKSTINTLCAELNTTLLNTIAPLIHSGSDFAKALPYLTNEQQTALINDYKTQLPTFTDSTDTLIAILQPLTPEHGAMIFKALSNELPRLFPSLTQLAAVLRSTRSEWSESLPL